VCTVCSVTAARIIGHDDCVVSFGLLSGVWRLLSNVSVYPVCSIFIGEWVRSVPKRWLLKSTRRKTTPKENIRYSKHSKNLKSRMMMMMTMMDYDDDDDEDDDDGNNNLQFISRKRVTPSVKAYPQ
jgi:hypothetical protein